MRSRWLRPKRNFASASIPTHLVSLCCVVAVRDIFLKVIEGRNPLANSTHQPLASQVIGPSNPCYVLVDQTTPPRRGRPTWRPTHAGGRKKKKEKKEKEKKKRKRGREREREGGRKGEKERREGQRERLNSHHSPFTFTILNEEFAWEMGKKKTFVVQSSFLLSEIIGNNCFIRGWDCNFAQTILRLKTP